MVRYSIEKLAHKTVVTDKGAVIGKVVDLICDELSGKMLSIIVEEIKGSEKSITRLLMKDAEGNLLLPYNTVSSIGDMVVVSEKLLQVYAATKRGG
ncbi:MAG: hypothetical protein DRO00_05705 [Thermoproteota archaeon]|nr:MAG: hypothetical protein DRO00_05705 [Candidatus Korarchaeota archaeon]